jgi:hypothetical protein
VCPVTLSCEASKTGAVDCCVWLLCTCCCLQAASPSRQELQLFLQEVKTLAQLHHRNIVQFYGACLEPGSLFFVTELMKVGAVEHLTVESVELTEGADWRGVDHHAADISKKLLLMALDGTGRYITCMRPLDGCTATEGLGRQPAVLPGTELCSWCWRTSACLNCCLHVIGEKHDGHCSHFEWMRCTADIQLTCGLLVMACLCGCGSSCCVSLVVSSQGGDLYSALRHHSHTMRWERLGRKVALDVALGLNYLHSQVRGAAAAVTGGRGGRG